MNTNQALSQSENNPAYILPNKPCLLRYGVEKSTSQSFIACIADIYSYKHNKALPSIEIMKNILASSITLDLFIKYQNGTLVSVFNVHDQENDNLQILLEKYKTSTFVKSLDKKNQIQMKLLVETISSYKNFLKFIEDKESLIDHTYLWDAITDSNQLLMKSGLNLIILEILNNDSTENISLICPTNSNSSFFDNKKECIILLKNGPYYEPIYQYEDKGTKLVITKGFKENIATENIMKTFEAIKKTQTKFCSPKAGKDKKLYTFNRNLNAIDIIDNLVKNNYFISYQIVNYQLKCIGLYATTKKNSPGVFVPCFPSEINSTLEIKYMDDDKIWETYENTIERLQKIKRITQIPFEPRIVVQEDQLAIGILTETNQFLQFSKPEITTQITAEHSNLTVINDSNYIVADKIMTTSNEEDKQRINSVKKIAVEQQFYLAFRTTTRLLLNSYDNRIIKNKILNIITNKNENKIYKKQLKLCIDLLHQLLDKDVSFERMDNDIIMSFVNITNCNKENSSKYCFLKDNKNILLIPNINLVSNFDNKILYFGKMADELIRNRRTKLFMLESNFLVTVPTTQYSVYKNELLIVRSLLNDDYFKNIVPFNTNRYVKNITYDIAEPSSNTSDPELQQESDPGPEQEPEPEQVLDNNQDKNMENIPVEFRHCINSIMDVTGNTTAEWRFPGAKEIHFKNDSIECSYSVIMYILSMEGIQSSISYIKDKLIEGYQKYTEKYEKNIIKILESQRKNHLMKEIKKKNITLIETIRSEKYYITDLDLWIIAREFDLPIVLFSSGKLKSMIDISWLYLSSNMNKFIGPLYFVRSPKLLPIDSPISYSLIEPKMTFKNLRGQGSVSMNNAVEGDKNFQNIQTYLNDMVIIYPK